MMPWSVELEWLVLILGPIVVVCSAALVGRQARRARRQVVSRARRRPSTTVRRISFYDWEAGE